LSDDKRDLDDRGSRLGKARKIEAVLDEEGALHNSSVHALDIGCSQGAILQYLSTRTGTCVGMDLDIAAMSVTQEAVAFVAGDGESMPFQEGTFDIVLCNHVYEHTENPQALFAEIHRVLKPSGMCYLAGPYRYSVIEPHYGLPFLSWLPRTCAHLYMRWTGKGQRYLWQPESRRKLNAALKRFELKDYTGKMIGDPHRYCMQDLLPPGSLRQLGARIIWRWLPAILPGFVYVLRKNADRH
jgi:SAM-dependent methyltransferase